MKRGNWLSKIAYILICAALMAVLVLLAVRERKSSELFRERQREAGQHESLTLSETPETEQETRQLTDAERERLAQAEAVVDEEKVQETLSESAVSSGRTAGDAASSEASDLAVTGPGLSRLSEKETETRTEAPASQNLAGEETETQTEADTEPENTDPEAPVLTLKTKTATIHSGDGFEAGTYVQSITDDSDNIYDLWRNIQVEGEYDASVPGQYTLYYYVTDSSGRSSVPQKFTLIVTDD